MSKNKPKGYRADTCLSCRHFTRMTVIALVLAGLFCTSLRYAAYRHGQLLSADDVWRIRYRIKFDAEEPGAHLHIAIPLDTANSRVFRKAVRQKETEDSSASKLKTKSLYRSTKPDAREITLTAPGRGLYQVVADFGIRSSRKDTLANLDDLPDSAAADRGHKYLDNEPAVQVDGKAVIETLDNLRDHGMTKEDLLDVLFDHCHSHIAASRTGRGPIDADSALKSGVANGLGKNRAFVALSRAAGIPARLVIGFKLEDTHDAVPHIWSEVFAKGSWQPYDPENGYSRNLPHYYVPIRCGGLAIAHGSSLSSIDENFSITKVHPSMGVSSADLWPSGDINLAEVFDLSRLPLEMHKTMSLLLLFPLAALLTALFRTSIGVDTIGSFTPALIALSFVYTGWQLGMLLLVLVVIIGLVGRNLLERMKLLLVPRLSIVLTLVVLSMILGLSILDYFALTPGTGIVLLPMVITTMIVERFYVANEESGVYQSIHLLAGTLVVAFLSYLILSWQRAGLLLLRYPEIHFFTMAGLILVGSYRGYRLTEIWRFRDLRNDLNRGINYVKNLPKKSKWWNWPRKLHLRGILGLNRRNRKYIMEYNCRANYPRVDNKIVTKQICSKQGIGVPETYAVIEHPHYVRMVPELVQARPQFVIKPASGSSGRGILVIDRHDNMEFKCADSRVISLDELRDHILTILSGLYSLETQSDQALIEQRLVSHEALAKFSVRGIPDIRIILYRGIPAMAMIRLPTRASGGRANLHQGAIALGIHLAEGVTLGGVCWNRSVTVHPDTGQLLTSLRIPYWHELLKGAIKLGEGLQLGCIGIDYAIDAYSGPVVLEANARPGLAIQIANRCGLISRLEFIDYSQPEYMTLQQRLDLVAPLAEMD